MPFLKANIDRAIVITQFDLRGFWHPLGFRTPEVSPKSLGAITWNLTAFAAHNGDDTSKPTDESFVESMSSPYVRYLIMCKRFAEDCDLSQKEAIQLIIQDILKTHAKLTAETQAGVRNHSAYLEELDSSTIWGRNTLALMEAFEVQDANNHTPVWTDPMSA